MKAFACAALVLLGLACPAVGLETVEDEHGTLNPQELTLDYFARRTEAKSFDPRMCVYGYPAAKMGNAALARRIFDRCANEGVLAAMPWMSWLDENGYDRPADPKSATAWDRRAAEAGWPIGELNYGLDLLRGWGVEQDVAKGRDFIDRAARQGNAEARILQQHGYDPDTVTPDPDRERYRKRVY